MDMNREKQQKASQLAEYKERRQKIIEMGGKEAVKRQKARGKLTARERIDALLDKDTFCEIGSFAVNRNKAY